MNPLELTHKMAFVFQPNFKHHLLDAQESRLQEFPGLLHAQVSQVLKRRLPGFRFEDMTESPDGEVHGAGQRTDRMRLTER